MRAPAAVVAKLVALDLDARAGLGGGADLVVRGGGAVVAALVALVADLVSLEIPPELVRSL